MRSISSFSRVTLPGIRMASPGPGKGWRPTKASGRPSSRPSADLVLEKFAQGFHQVHFHAFRQAAHVVVGLDGRAGSAVEGHGLDHVRIERVPCARKSAPPILFASASKTSMNAAPMILRFSSGSDTPSNLSRKSSEASAWTRECCGDLEKGPRPPPPRPRASCPYRRRHR